MTDQQINQLDALRAVINGLEILKKRLTGVDVTLKFYVSAGDTKNENYLSLRDDLMTEQLADIEKELLIDYIDLRIGKLKNVIKEI